MQVMVKITFSFPEGPFIYFYKGGVCGRICPFFDPFYSILVIYAVRISVKYKVRDPNGGYDQKEIKRNKALNHFKQNCPKAESDTT